MGDQSIRSCSTLAKDEQDLSIIYPFEKEIFGINDDPIAGAKVHVLDRGHEIKLDGVLMSLCNIQKSTW